MLNLTHIFLPDHTTNLLYIYIIPNIPRFQVSPKGITPLINLFDEWLWILRVIEILASIERDENDFAIRNEDLDSLTDPEFRVIL